LLNCKHPILQDTEKHPDQGNKDYLQDPFPRREHSLEGAKLFLQHTKERLDQGSKDYLQDPFLLLEHSRVEEEEPRLWWQVWWVGRGDSLGWGSCILL